MKTPNFEILPNDNAADDTMHGRTTIVRRVGGALEKFPRFDADKKRWMANIIRVRTITNSLRKINNPAYKIPKTYISHGRVHEEFVSGHTLAARGDKKRDFLIPAIANLINDMTELRPIITHNENRVQSVWFIDDADALEKMLHVFDGTPREIPDADIELIRMVYAYVRDLPENREMVFAHNDLADSNIIVDTDGVVNFIDFSGAGYRTRLWVRRTMNPYSKFFTGGADAVWQYVEKLPRKNNPKLSWAIAPEILDLHEALLRTCFVAKRYCDGMGASWYEFAGASIRDLRRSMTRVLGANKIISRQKIM